MISVNCVKFCTMHASQTMQAPALLAMHALRTIYNQCALSRQCCAVSRSTGPTTEVSGLRHSWNISTKQCPGLLHAEDIFSITIKTIPGTLVTVHISRKVIVMNSVSHFC